MRPNAWIALAGVLAFLGTNPSAPAAGGALEIRDGYFWDPQVGEFFVPRGIAYQTWNPPVYANQSFEQVDYDLREFARMRTNSVRAEFVWSQVETSPGVFDWSKPDYLVAKAEEHGLKLFLIIGFQYPPGWFEDEWYATNDRGDQSDVLNYEDSRAQAAYTNYIRAVTRRYQDNTTVAAWILGNEFAYFDLWEDPDDYPARRMLGYDPVSLESFRTYLQEKYAGDIAALNANWGSSFANFGEVTMPESYPLDRHDPGYHDLIRWRQRGIGNFIALGAAAAREEDPNHLLTYSMVGSVFNGYDTNNTCEDGVAIVERCEAAGAPLDFWSINNYSWAVEGTELRFGDYGVSKYQELLGIPVVLSETGSSSTDNILIGAGPRQPNAVPGALWEALMSGAIGVHLFHWSDRDQFLGGFFQREAGFGIVSQKRLPKPSVFENTAALFNRADEIGLDNLLGGSTSPPSDVLFYWSGASEMGWPRANIENAMFWGALKRTGFQPGLVDDIGFAAGDFGEAKAVTLSRAYQLEPEDLDRLAPQVLGRGIHLHANADLPGRFDTYHRPNPGWQASMENLFGLDVSRATPSLDGGVHPREAATYREIVLQSAQPFGQFGEGYRQPILTWKAWQEVGVTEGMTVLRHGGLAGGEPVLPAVHFKDHPAAKAAINLFALGETHNPNSSPENPDAILWDIRSDLVGTIFGDYFEIEPTIKVEGSGATYVTSDYRVCRNGSFLVTLMNGHTEPAEIQVTSPSLFDGRTVENLTAGGLMESGDDGKLAVSIEGDGFVLLHIYGEGGSGPASLVNPDRPKLWFDSVPDTVEPASAVEVTVRYDARGANLEIGVCLEQESPSGHLTRACSASTAISGAGSAVLGLPVPDADLGDPSYRSTRDGGRYRVRTYLLDRGAPVSEASMPVRFALGPRPASLPENPLPGQRYDVGVVWDELPTYEPDDAGTPFGRAVLWDSEHATRSHYNIVLQLVDESGEILAAQEVVTREESGGHTFGFPIPSDATGPLGWRVLAQASPGASDDVQESLEGRETGANIIWPPPDDPPPPREVDLIAPWELGFYSQAANEGRPDAPNLYQNHGVQLTGSHGSQSMFIVAGNPTTAGDYSGFFIAYPFPSARAIPASFEERENYRFSVDFKEDAGLGCTIELQLKDTANRVAKFTRPYAPGADGWHTLSATLDQFDRDTLDFDWANIKEMLFVVAMQEKGDAVQYVASIDNIVFDGPENVVTDGPVIIAYESANDSLPDRDRDGVPDAHENGTGEFTSETATGTDPDVADTDGDGQTDGQEVAAGTDPTSAAERFRVERVEHGEDKLSLVFNAKTGRTYGVELWSQVSQEEAGAFRLLPGFAEMTVPEAGSTAVDLDLTLVGESPLLRLTARRSP